MLGVAAALSALLTYLVSDVLRGPAVMNGSARGTALVVLVVGVPVLACSLVLARRGSAIAVVTWLAAIGFLLYNALMFVFATPVNRLFLLYLAMLSLAAWSAGTLLWHTDTQALGRLVPVWLAAGYLWALVVLNGGAWLVRILPSLASSGEPAYLRGTGMTTNIVFVQDLALWVPLMAVAAAWLWQRTPRGYLLGGASIVMGAMESISIAADQWYGHAADPASTVVSAVLTPIFAALAVLSLAVAWLLLRGLATARTSAPSPALPHRDWAAWLMAGLAVLIAAASAFGGIRLIHDGLGMPAGYLTATPFSSWVLPGLALLIGVAVPQLAAAILIAAGHRWPLPASYLAGVALVAWILVQLLVMQRYFFLQPVIAALGIVELALVRAWQQAGPRAGPPAAPARAARLTSRPVRLRRGSVTMTACPILSCAVLAAGQCPAAPLGVKSRIDRQALLHGPVRKPRRLRLPPIPGRVELANRLDDPSQHRVPEHLVAGGGLSRGGGWQRISR